MDAAAASRAGRRAGSLYAVPTQDPIGPRIRFLQPQHRQVREVPATTPYKPRRVGASISSATSSSATPTTMASPGRQAVRHPQREFEIDRKTDKGRSSFSGTSAWPCVHCGRAMSRSTRSAASAKDSLVQRGRLPSQRQYARRARPGKDPLETLPVGERVFARRSVADRSPRSKAPPS